MKSRKISAPVSAVMPASVLICNTNVYVKK